jgi:hypothetical protein
MKNLLRLKAIGFLIIYFAIMLKASQLPFPTCNSPNLAPSDVPIALDESQFFNMDDIFSGYNLKFSVKNGPSFVDLKEKMKL